VIKVLLEELAFSKFSFNSSILEALVISHLLMPAALTLQKLSITTHDHVVSGVKWDL
jgi:hypothetical protein